MDLKEQRIAIAEACGWTKLQWRGGKAKRIFLVGIKPGYTFKKPRAVEDFTSDLNALHDAESQLLDNSNGQTFIEHLCKIRGGWEHNTISDLFVRSTAQQRAEALLRTIGKWVES